MTTRSVITAVFCILMTPLAGCFDPDDYAIGGDGHRVGDNSWEHADHFQKPGPGLAAFQRI